jgi:CDP-glucose 4,6-dehydratase
VLEPLRGYLTLAQRLVEEPSRFAAGWNFGPIDTDAKPVEWIADKLARSWGDGASWVQDSRIHPREARFLKLDASKSKAELDWYPALPLEQALGWIVEWYRTFERGQDIRALTLAQIERYEARTRKSNQLVETAEPV